MAELNGVELIGLVLHSGRLTLRPFQPTDADRVSAIMADERMHHYLDLPNPYPPGAARAFAVDYAPAGAVDGKHLTLAIAENTTATVVGAIGLHGLKDGAMSPELGYWIASEHWGNGYATEAVQTVTRFALGNGLLRIGIRCDVDNVGSAKVALKAGYRFEGVERNGLSSAGGLRDGARFARLPADPDQPVAPSLAAMPPQTDTTVTVRPMTAQDWPTVLAERNNELSRSWGFGHDQMSEQNARSFAAAAPLEWLTGSQARLVICDAATGEGAGTLTLRQQGPPDIAGIGYGVLPSYRGRGFTTRALDLVANWAFSSTSIARLELGCKQGNVASMRSASKAGFTQDGYFPGRLRNPEGGYSDEVRYSRLRPPTG